MNEQAYVSVRLVILKRAYATHLVEPLFVTMNACFKMILIDFRIQRRLPLVHLLIGRFVA